MGASCANARAPATSHTTAHPLRTQDPMSSLTISSAQALA
jgi:hypothetical protein